MARHLLLLRAVRGAFRSNDRRSAPGRADREHRRHRAGLLDLPACVGRHGGGRGGRCLCLAVIEPLDAGICRTCDALCRCVWVGGNSLFTTGHRAVAADALFPGRPVCRPGSHHEAAGSCVCRLCCRLVALAGMACVDTKSNSSHAAGSRAAGRRSDSLRDSFRFAVGDTHVERILAVDDFVRALLRRAA